MLRKLGGKATSQIYLGRKANHQQFLGRKSAPQRRRRTGPY
jgi:hypothetical protein